MVKGSMVTTQCFQEVETNCGHSLDIDRVDWENGYGLFRFDLTPAGSGSVSV